MVNTAAGPPGVAVKAVGQSAPTQQVVSAVLLTKIETLLLKLDVAAKVEEAKATASVKNFFAKHWPWMTGLVVAATRFLHL